MRFTNRIIHWQAAQPLTKAAKAQKQAAELRAKAALAKASKAERRLAELRAKGGRKSRKEDDLGDWPKPKKGSGGCGCSSSPRSVPVGGLFVAFVLALFVRRRNRSSEA